MSALHSTSPTPLGAWPAGLGAIFVIHASKFIERGKLIRSQLNGLGLPFEFVLGFDAPAITDDVRQQFFRNSTLSPAQQSCALKHWQAHQLIVERKLDRALILEDDVILSPEFQTVFNRMMLEDLAIVGPHVTFLGCGGHYYVGPDEVRNGQLLYPRNQGKFADSYIISLAAATRRIDWIEAHGIARPIDHLFEQIDRELGTPMFWLEPPIVEQGSHNGAFGSALDKSHPLWFQALQFRWKKMWRRRHHQ
jgi:glycosyl transferase, family 25